MKCILYYLIQLPHIPPAPFLSRAERALRNPCCQSLRRRTCHTNPPPPEPPDEAAPAGSHRSDGSLKDCKEGERGQKTANSEQHAVQRKIDSAYCVLANLTLKKVQKKEKVEDGFTSVM